MAGLHSNAYINDLFAKAYATEGMKAYVELIQSREREIGCDVLTHQKVRFVRRVLHILLLTYVSDSGAAPITWTTS